LFSFLIFPSVISAAELESKHFRIHIHEGIDNYQLLEKLRIKHFLHLDVIPLKGSSNAESLIKDTLDEIYLEVSDVIDIHMDDLKINLRVFPNKDYLGEVLIQFYGKKMDLPSFYLYEKNTIYISNDDLKVGMLAHEIAHALISNYFTVPPPTKVQEILAGYAEYSLRKALSELP
jgi:hypothetical protein